jgi:hypothetical protein
MRQVGVPSGAMQAGAGGGVAEDLARYKGRILLHTSYVGVQVLLDGCNHWQGREGERGRCHGRISLPMRQV